MPTYSALGKLFSPVPHTLPDGRASTLFDEFMISMSSVPSRIREGMLLLSGDVFLLLKPLQIDFSGRGAAAISFKENVETGKNHGVFLNGENGNVRKFLHKQTVEVLKSLGAVNEKDCVDIDTGAVIFAPEILDALYSLVDTESRYQKFVNDTVRLSLYGDFLYPLAEDSSLEAFYREKPEGRFCPELEEARTAVCEKLRPCRMKLLRLAPARFIHFGTTKEILALMSCGVEDYRALSWKRKVNSSILGDAVGYNSILSRKAEIGKDCYLEVSYVHSKVVVGNRVLLSHIDIHEEVVPDDVVLHGLKQKNGKFVCRIYGTMDNPKEVRFFGRGLSELIREWGMEESDVWETDDHTLWTARLYPECDSILEAVAAALELYRLAQQGGEGCVWRASGRKSLCSGFHDADPEAIIAWNRRMRELVQMDEIAKKIADKISASSLRHLDEFTPVQKEWLQKRLERTDFSEKIRLFYYIGTAVGGKEGNALTEECFRTIAGTIQQEAMKGIRLNEICRMICDSHVVRLPLRVNWGGGWSDTPPVCCETGGTVLNAAIRLNGELPVEVRLKKNTGEKDCI